MSQDSTFDQFVTQLRAGDEDAASRVFQRFAGRLIRLAHRHLDSRTRQKVDAEDVVQSVFKSFFLRVSDNRLDLTSWDSLWGLLVVITLRKCGKKFRHFHGPQRDIQKEVSTSTGGDDSNAGWEALAQDPTPSQAAILAETLEQVMAGLKDRERQILELRLQGHSAAEISAQVGRTEHTVNWVLKRIRKRLQHLRDEPGKEVGAV